MKKFIILIPLYNDWKSVSKLLDEIDNKTKDWAADVSVIIVNDASTEKVSNISQSYKKIKFVKILNMKENRVHQRCIATGLKYIYKNEDFDFVIVMDADGEDRPEELNDFYKKTEENPNMTITGNRFKRSEGFIFKFLYEVHKVLTFIFTGKLIKFGNFSCLPKPHAGILLEKAYLWNSYSSAVTSAIKDRTFIHSTRGVRYVLPSKMNFIGLVFHSLAIISVFKKTVIARSIILSFIYLFLVIQNISLLTLFPIFFLILFVFTIQKISKRENMEEFNRALDNIDSIDILANSDGR